MISDNLEQIRADIHRLEDAHQRTAGDVTLLAVSKKKPVEDIRQAIDAGQTCFGENYADEGVEKITAIANESIDWHYIGHIQSNKTRLIATHYDWVQGVERAKILQRLAQHRPDHLPPLNICLQVNIDAEDSKSGCSPEQLMELAAQTDGKPEIILRGIMAIPAPQTDLAAQRAAFAQLATLYRSLQARYPQVDTLSMGMSGDMEAAIAEGATMVRIGTAIFGSRD